MTSPTSRCSPRCLRSAASAIRSGNGWRQRHFCRPTGCPRLAHRPLRPEGDEVGMNDFGLDLAVIGNGRTAALVNPMSRIVWWCYPRFDGDPIFSRLVAGGEEKGFSDVLLEGMVDFSSDYVRNTPIVS